MRQAKLSDMQGGWFIGDFSPVALKTPFAEVAVKSYQMGAHEEIHHHRVAVEVTLILTGNARMADETFGPGDIVILEPGDATGFTALTDVTTVVVKLPSVPGDKYAGSFTNA